MKPPHSHRPGRHGPAGPGHSGSGPAPAGGRNDRAPRGAHQDARPERPFRDDRRQGLHLPREAGERGGPRQHGGPHAGPNAPRGAIWLYGTHAVAAALANPARRLRRLLLTEEAEAEIASRLQQPWPLPPERSDRGRLDQLLGRDIVHQGTALLADPLAPPALAQVLERPGPLLVLDQVTDPRNVGAILRSAAAFGAAGVITQERNAPEETGALAKAASGALELVPLVNVQNLARALEALKHSGFLVVGLDSSGDSDLAALPLRAPLALVLGAEGKGLRQLTKATCDHVARIDLPGAIKSLNVSNAAALALYVVTRPLKNETAGR